MFERLKLLSGGQGFFSPKHATPQFHTGTMAKKSRQKNCARSTFTDISRAFCAPSQHQPNAEVNEAQ